MKYRLKDLIDMEQFQTLQDRLNEIYSFPSAIIDNDGTILTATAWQDICIKFHRQNKECERECLKSDQYIRSHIAEANPAVSYRCPHGLIDNAIPIIVDGEHLGNFFTGQFFLEEPDLEFFKQQAKRYGFDEGQYLEAVRKVPVWTQEKLNSYLFFIKGLIEVISSTGLKNLRAIEARQKAEESEKQFETMFEMAAIGMAQCDPHTGQWLRVNQKMCDITGYTPREMLALRVPDITHPDDREGDWEAFKRVVRGEAPNYHLEKRYIRKDGAVVCVSVNMTVIRDETGQPLRTMATIEDITERRHTEEALRESRAMMEAALSSMTDAVFISDTAGQFVEFNDAFATFHRFKNKSECARKLSDYPDILEVYMANGERAPLEMWAVPRALRGETATNAEYTLRRKDTGETWVGSFSFSPIRDKDGTIAGSVVVGRDITERKRTEEALRKSVQRFRSYFESPIIGVAITSIEKGWLEVNERLCAMLEYSRQELLGLTWVELTHPDDLAADVVQFARMLAGEIDDYSMDKRFVRKSGEVIWTHLGVGCVRNPDGSVNYVVALLQDITERKQAEDALRQAHGRIRRLVDSNIVGVVIASPSGGIIEANDYYLRMTGYTREELEQGMLDWRAITPPEWMPTDEHAIEELRERGMCTPYEKEYVRRDGTRVSVFMSDTILPGPEEQIAAFCLDITERKRAEKEQARLQAQLQQAQKLQSVGRLAGGVAHDFNNMLGVILGHVEFALEQVDPTQPLHDDLEEIRKAASRSVDLTRQLLTFARKQLVAPKVLDLNESIANMLKMLQRLVGENISLNWHPSANLWPVEVDPSQLDQIIANLCVNARDAIADVGRIIIETENSTFDAEYCEQHEGFVPGEYVRLAVSDNGCGMDPETQAHIFEPFFTTKGVGEGTGLGLATVYGAVKQNNGFINVYSEPGEETTFTIYLPRHVSEAKQTRPQAASEPSVHGHETILLVEDELAILKMTTRLLEYKGYAVLPASTPGEAIRLAREYDGKIHLLMTDVVMPEMNGRDLAQQLLSSYPDLKRLFMSGYTADIITHHGVLDEGMHFIQKPFSTQSLAAKIREVLDTQQNPHA